MFGDSEMYSSFANPHSNSAQSFQIPVESSSSPPPSFHMPTNSSSSHPHPPMPNMAMSTVSLPQLEISQHAFSHELYHAPFSPHMNINIPGGSLGSLQEAVLLPQPIQAVMSPQCQAQAQQNFGINETVSNSVFSPQNCPNPSPFPPQDCPKPEVKGSEIVNIGAGGVELEEEMKKNSKEGVQKKRAKNWNKFEISKLAKWRCEMEPRFEKGARKAELWEEIADALKGDGINRDSHQCRDKWEKFMGAYKNWLKDGGKGKDDTSLFEGLNELLGGKAPKREMEHVGEAVLEDGTEERFLRDSQFIDEEETDVDMATLPGRKRKRPNYVSVSDLSVVKELVGTVIDIYHRKMKEVFEVLDRREQAREQARLDKEEKWRAEDFAQREAFHNTMLSVVKNLVHDHPRNVEASTAVAAQTPQLKKRSRNWKVPEVRELIRLRGEMDGRFQEVARRTPLWEELSEKLGVKGIDRDAKQCKEKWDKLQADYREVVEEKKDAALSPFFQELQPILGRLNCQVENVKLENISMENVKLENISMENVKPDNVNMENVHPENDIMDNAHPDSVTTENTFVENVNPQ